MSTNQSDIKNVHNSDLYLYFYEDSLSEERTVKECDFIEQECGIGSSQSILDLACGHGRHSIELAARNHTVCGIDINTAFINIAQKDAAQKNLQVEFIEGDILQSIEKEAFDTILLCFNTLGFLIEKMLEKMLEKY